jgi:hypothetical protein
MPRRNPAGGGHEESDGEVVRVSFVFCIGDAIDSVSGHGRYFNYAVAAIRGNQMTSITDEYRGKAHEAEVMELETHDLFCAERIQSSLVIGGS